MATQTTNLNLSKPSLTDTKHSTINSLAINFQKIDDAAEISMDAIPTFGVWQKYKRIWNISTTIKIGDPTHWYNLRTGTAAQKWNSLTKYEIGSTVTSNVDNTHFYTCTQAGYGCIKEPSFPLTSASIIKDINGSNFWEPSKYYNLNDVVLPTNDNGRFYLCIQAGNAGITEPSWSINVLSDTREDTSSLYWRCYTIAKWQESGTSALFRPAGIIS